MSVPRAQLRQQHRQPRLDHHEQRHALLPRQPRQPPCTSAGTSSRHRVPAVARAQPAAAGRPATPAQPAPPPAPPATTPPARQQAARIVRRAQQLPLPDRVVRVLHRQRRPSRRPALPAAPRRPATGPGPASPSTSRRSPRDAAPAPARARPGRRPAAAPAPGSAPPGRTAPRRRPPPPRPGPARPPRHRQLPAQLAMPSTRWNGCPSAAGKTVRSTSCRAITSPSAAPSAAVSSSPSRRSASGMLYSADGPSSWAMNHSRCCANDNGTRTGRGCGASAARAGPACASRTASPAGVGASNTALTSSSAPSTTRTRRRQPHRQQRVPAQREEIILGTDPVHAQHLGEHAAQQLLGHRRGLPARRAPPRSPGRAARPGRACRWGSAATRPASSPRPDHVLRQPAAACSRAAAARPSRSVTSRGGHHVADEPLVAGDVLADDHRGLGHPGQAASTACDLARLHPEPADLHLLIRPPANISCPPGPLGEVPGPVHPLPGRPEQAGDEPLRGQRRAALPPIILFDTFFGFRVP